MKLWFGFFFLLSFLANGRLSGEGKGNELEAKPCEIQFQGRPHEFSLYVPKAYNAERKWFVFISVHADRATGRDMIPMFIRDADKDGFILLCPTLNGEFYNMNGEQDLVLIQMLKDVGRRYNIQPRVFITGIAGGADFALRFSMKYPDIILACSLHSTTALLPSELEIKRHFPIVLTAGMDDVHSSKHTPLLTKGLKVQGFSVQEVLYEGVGVAWNDEAQELCREHFRNVSTGLTKEQRATLVELRSRIDQESFGEALKAIHQMVKETRSAAFGTALKDLQKQIDKEGLARFQAVREALKEEPQELLAELENLAPQFPGTEAGRQIRLAMQEIRKKSSAPAARQDSTEAGGGAGEKGAEEDPEERKARSMLNNAKNLVTAGNKKAAGSTLQQLLSKYPESACAAEARKLLDELGESGQ